MVIDCEEKLNEKQAKELLTSFNNLIRNIADTLRQSPASIKTFFILFDNKNEFNITIYNNYAYMEYIDIYGNTKEELSLQEVLNINKYSKDIENKLEQIKETGSFQLEAYFTEQDVNKMIPIFAENNVKLRCFKNEEEYIKGNNVLDSDDEFEL